MRWDNALTDEVAEAARIEAYKEARRARYAAQRLKNMPPAQRLQLEISRKQQAALAEDKDT